MVKAITNDEHHNVQHGQHSAAASQPPNEDAKEALAIQNNERKLHGCPPLVWDAKLSEDALGWAIHLASIEKMVHSTGDQRPGEGENLFSGWQSGGPYTNPLRSGAQAWINEKKDYHGEKIGEGDFEKYGHYTQCVWKKTTRVGMAQALGKNGWVYVVGRYSPAGNFAGQKPY